MSNAMDIDQSVENLGASRRKRKGLLICGMHRSGTSLSAGIMCYLGAAAPASLMAANEFNETGYWESNRFFKLNERLLNEAGSAWHDIMPIEPSFFESDRVEAHISDICCAIGSEYPDDTLICVKDPRISRLLPLWLAAFERLDIEPLVVVPQRSPLDVAASLKRRNDLSLPYAQMLWLRYVLDCERYSRGLKRSFVAYEDLIADWRGCVTRIANDLGLVWPKLQSRSAAQVDHMVSARYRHHSSKPSDLEVHPYVSSLVRSASQALVEAASGKGSDPHEALAAIASQMDAADRLYAELLAEKELERDAEREAAKAARNEVDEEKAARALAETALAEARAAATEAEEVHRRELSQRDEMLAAAEAGREKVEGALAEARQQLTAVRNEADEEKAARAVAETALSEARAAASEAEEVLRRELSQRDEKLAAAEAGREKVEGALAEARQQLTAVRNEADEEKAARAVAETALSEARAAASEAEEVLRRELSQRDEMLAAAEAGREKVEGALAEARQQLTAVRNEADEEKAARAVAETALSEARAAASEAEEVLRRELSQRDEKLAAAEAGREKVEGALAEARQQLTAVRNEADEEKAARAVAETALSEARAAASEAEEVLRRELAQRDEKLAAAEAGRKKIESELADLDSKSKLRFDDVAKLTQLLKDTKIRRSELTAELDENITFYQQEIADQKAKIASLKESLDVAINERDIESAKISDFTNKLSQAQADVDRQTSKVEVLRKERDTLKRDNASLALKLDARFQELAQMTQILQGSDEQLDALRDQLSRCQLSAARAVGKVITGVVGFSEQKPPTHAELMAISRLFTEAKLFNAEYYCERYPDVAEAGIDPMMHYFAYGAFEGRVPFDLALDAE